MRPMMEYILRPPMRPGSSTRGSDLPGQVQSGVPNQEPLTVWGTMSKGAALRQQPLAGLIKGLENREV